MQVKPLSLRELTLSNNIFLAPMAGYTDFAFRSVALETGYSLAFTELVSAKGLCYGGNGSKELLRSDGNFDKTAVQLFGSDPFFMRKACEMDELKNFNIVDINMGCPVPKVFKNGEGSALLTDIVKAQNVIKECVKSGKIITVKIRTGQKKGDDIATDYAKMAEDSGASLITIHGRVREAYYSGEVDFNAIEKAKKSVKIPVIANGGIFTKEDAGIIMDRTGADGVMLARGGIANPFLPCELLGKENPFTLKEFIKKQLLLMLEVGGERSAVEFRKFIPYYFKGREHFKEERLKLLSLNTVSELLAEIDKID